MNYNQSERLLQMRDGRYRPERAGSSWGDEEREDLQFYYLKGMGISEIALLLNRGEMAVVQQLMATELLTSPGLRRSRTPKVPKCLCDQCSFRDQCPKNQSGCAYA